MPASRIVRRSTRFKRDYKREMSGRFAKILDAEFLRVMKLLLADMPLPGSYRDHPLLGEWKGHRDCHIRPDLILIYRKPDEMHLDLVRLGSHSELGS